MGEEDGGRGRGEIGMSGNEKGEGTPVSEVVSPYTSIPTHTLIVCVLEWNGSVL